MDWTNSEMRKAVCAASPVIRVVERMDYSKPYGQQYIHDSIDLIDTDGEHLYRCSRYSEACHMQHTIGINRAAI